jgi:hypothetical protein
MLRRGRVHRRSGTRRGGHATRWSCLLAAGPPIFDPSPGTRGELSLRSTTLSKGVGAA